MARCVRLEDAKVLGAGDDKRALAAFRGHSRGEHATNETTEGERDRWQGLPVSVTHMDAE